MPRTNPSWDSSDCERTPRCPPRCPRFVDREGTRWTVRPIDDTERERERLCELYAAFDPEHRAQGLPPTREQQLEQWLDHLLENGWNAVAEPTGPIRDSDVQPSISGHAVYTPTDDPEPELAVFVHPALHGRGIGTELCRQVVATAADRGHRAIVLDVERRNRGAVAVYRKLGFEPIEAGSGEMRMRLPLTADAGSDDLIAGTP